VLLMFCGNRNSKGGFRLWPKLTHCFPRYYNLFRDMEFQKSVDRHFGGKGVRALTCWGQFSTLLFGQITGHSSIRSMIAAINTQERFLYHLGMRPVKRSTLSDANENRAPRILEGIFYNLLSRTQAYAPGRHFRFKEEILAMDSSTINLCLNLCPWAQFHHGKGAFNCIRQLI
jgi:hypothetical protein